MSPETSAALHQRALARVTAFVASAPPPEPFDALACDVARYQVARSEGFARLCRARGADPATLASAEAIPPVPTDAFKLTRVSTFAPAETALTFRTSGTTASARGEHFFRDVTTYEAAAVAFGRHWLARDLTAPVPVIVLGPSPAEAPDSSLVHMCASFVKELGVPASAAETYLIDAEGVLDLATFDERVAIALANNQPMLVLGTSFAFVHFIDGLGKDSFPLPRGSRVMQTGGYKGRSREVPADVLRSDLARAFGLDRRAIVAEYGMTELSSQFYERTLWEPMAPHNRYASPPWARVIPVDPDTLEPVADGEVGIAKIIDLLNVDSAVAILTQDRVRRIDDSFELLGRAPGAPSRGCSIAIDELLGG